MTNPPGTTHDAVCDLQARMLTCSTHLATIEISEILRDDQMEAIIAARSMLVEAANLLEQLKPPPFLGEVMAMIEPLPPGAQINHEPQSFRQSKSLIDPGVPTLLQHPVSKNACPNCDSRANKTVVRQGSKLFMECPVCGHHWPFAGRAKWV
jgi:hypothetical protein